MTTSFEQMMAELQLEYVNSIPQKIDDINSHIQAKDSASLREDFHKLKGTGKTYGIAEISEFAEVVEKICMNKPGTATQAATLGVNLLRHIHESRLKKIAFNVSAHPDFLTIKNL